MRGAGSPFRVAVSSSANEAAKSNSLDQFTQIGNYEALARQAVQGLGGMRLGERMDYQNQYTPTITTAMSFNGANLLADYNQNQ